MDQDKQLLKEVVHNARLGRDAVTYLLSATKNEELTRELNDQAKKYKQILQSAEEALREAGATPEWTNPIARAGTYLGIKAHMAVHGDDEGLKALMEENQEIGQLEAERLIQRYEGAGEAETAITQTLLEAERKPIQQKEES